MNTETDIIEEYFSKLPVIVQDCVGSDEWQKRLDEMTTKYSLDKNQSVALQYEILFVVMGIEPEQDLSENIKNELGVSGLLAEQLAKDTEERLLSWIDKLYSTSDTGRSNKLTPVNPKLSNTNQTTSGVTLNIENDILEVRPEITPMVEKDEVVHNIVPPANNEVKPEPVQRPISVPRYTGEQGEMTNDQPASPSQGGFPMTNQGQSFNDKIDAMAQKAPEPTPAVETKPIVEAIKPQGQPKTPEPVPEAPKRYTVDPYREPIE